MTDLKRSGRGDGNGELTVGLISTLCLDVGDFGHVDDEDVKRWLCTSFGYSHVLLFGREIKRIYIIR